jgi:hypothetical protein
MHSSKTHLDHNAPGRCLGEERRKEGREAGRNKHSTNEEEIEIFIKNLEIHKYWIMTTAAPMLPVYSPTRSAANYCNEYAPFLNGHCHNFMKATHIDIGKDELMQVECLDTFQREILGK